MNAAATPPPGGSGMGARIGPPTPRVGVLIVAAVVVGVVLVLAGSAVTPFAVGVLLMYLLAPPIDRLARLGVPRSISILLVYAGVIVVVYALLRLTLTPLLIQLQAFAANLPEVAQTVRTTVLDFYKSTHISPEIRTAIDNAVGDLGSVLGGLNPGTILPVVSSVAGFVISLFGYAILPAWMFYVLKDRPRLQESFERALPHGWRADAAALIRIVNRVVGQWIRGQVVLGLSVGIASYVGLIFLGAVVDPVFSDYAILLAVTSAFLELVPIIGPIIATVPAVVVGLGGGAQGVIAVLALYFVIQQIENNVLVPKIQGDAVRLHPSAVVFFLVVGGAIGGLLGAIVSLPLAAMGRDIVVYLFHRLDDPPMSVAAATALVLGEPAAETAVRREVSPRTVRPVERHRTETAAGAIETSADPRPGPLEPRASQGEGPGDARRAGTRGAES